MQERTAPTLPGLPVLLVLVAALIFVGYSGVQAGRRTRSASCWPTS
jgi:hypothetical protein